MTDLMQQMIAEIEKLPAMNKKDGRIGFWKN